MRVIYQNIAPSGKLHLDAGIMEIIKQDQKTNPGQKYQVKVEITRAKEKWRRGNKIIYEVDKEPII